jgi:hypothetical protein
MKPSGATKSIQYPSNLPVWTIEVGDVFVERLAVGDIDESLFSVGESWVMFTCAGLAHQRMIFDPNSARQLREGWA